MKFGGEFLEQIADKIWMNALPYEDTIIIGENSSGKSLLLKLLVQKAGKADSIYFIDAVNRSFDVKAVSIEHRTLRYERKIVDTRISELYFNVKDSFSCFGTLTEGVERVYLRFEQEVQELFEQLTKERFRITPKDILGEVEFTNGRGLLSSGYQAIVRLLLELVYYQKTCIEKGEIQGALVIIDELDEFLSPGYSSRIFRFLKEKFPEMRLAVTTHSCDLVAGASNANLVILDDAGYEVVDGNDYSSVSEVQLLFGRVFGEPITEESGTETVLRRLLNNKLNDVWTEKDQLQLEQLQQEPLTASQKLIWRQISEW